MKFLPFENITYKTHLKEDELINRLSEHVESEKRFRFGMFGSGSSKLYEGEISGLTFNLKRIISYRNSFLPRIHGVIEKEMDGSTIKVKMRLSTFVIVFLCFWFGVVGLACIALISEASHLEFNPAMLIPFGMLGFAYLMTIGGFKYESIKSKKHLQTLFEADIIEE